MGRSKAMKEQSWESGPPIRLWHRGLFSEKEEELGIAGK
jgi:hypothetical protein